MRGEIYGEHILLVVEVSIGPITINIYYSVLLVVKVLTGMGPYY
jgi:hypothetical protein